MDETLAKKKSSNSSLYRQKWWSESYTLRDQPTLTKSLQIVTRDADLINLNVQFSFQFPISFPKSYSYNFLRWHNIDVLDIEGLKW